MAAEAEYYPAGRVGQRACKYFLAADAGWRQLAAIDGAQINDIGGDMFGLLFRQRLFLTLAGGAANFVALPKPLIAMSQDTAGQRQHAPYAALKPPADGDAAKAQRDPDSPAGPSTAPAAETDYLAAEADRLENLK